MNDGAVKLSETERAYFAGLVDARATIFVKRTLRAGRVVRRQMEMCLAGLSEKQAQWVKERFKGASLRVSRNEQARNVHFVTRWAAHALSEVGSYLVSSIREANLVFRFADAANKRGQRGLTSIQAQVCAEVDLELTALKRGA